MFFYKCPSLLFKLSTTHITCELEGISVCQPLPIFEEKGVYATFASLPIRRYQAATLVIAPDLVIFRSISMDVALQKCQHLPAFLREVWLELSDEYPEENLYFCDAVIKAILPEALEVEVALVSKDKLESVLRVLSRARLRLQNIKIADEAFNLLPWRQYALMRSYLRQYLSLILPSLLVLAGVVLFAMHQTRELTKNQKLLNTLHQQQAALTVNSLQGVPLETLHAFATALLGARQAGLGVNEIRLQGEDELWVAGVAQPGVAVAQQLDTLATLPMLQPHSLAHFEVDRREREQHWQVNFRLRAAE